MSLWDRIRGFGPSGYRARRAADLERNGSIAAAIDAYLAAERPNEAARLWLVRADAEPTLARRLVFFEQAASVATDPEIKRQAKARRAKLSFELLRESGAVAKSEMCVVAEELMAAGEPLVAAEAFAIAGDGEGEVRALTSAGAIDRLEEKLSGQAERERAMTHTNATLLRLKDLERGAERRAALALARDSASEDRRIEDLARVIRQRVVRGPLCELAFHGQPMTVVLGDELTVGRGDASIVVESRALSRVHLRVRRDASGAPVAEDAGTRNGTFVGGARLAGPVPVGERLALRLGGEIDCVVSRDESDRIAVLIAGQRYVASLGPLRLGQASLRLAGKGGDEHSFVELESEQTAPVFREGLQLAKVVEVALGDAFSFARSAEPALVIGKPAAS